MSSTAETPSVEKEKKVRFQREHFEYIVLWLEDQTNFGKLNGTSGKTKVGGENCSKGTAYTELANYLNRKAKVKIPGLTGNSMRQRFEHYHKRFKDTFKWHREQTGSGITAKDRKKSIHTIEAKLDSMCPLYARMQILFGERPNISPPAIQEVGTVDDNDGNEGAGGHREENEQGKEDEQGKENEQVEQEKDDSDSEEDDVLPDPLTDDDDVDMDPLVARGKAANATAQQTPGTKPQTPGTKPQTSGTKPQTASTKRKRGPSTPGTPANKATPRAKLSLAEAYQEKGANQIQYLKDKLSAEKDEKELARTHEKNLRKIQLLQTLVDKDYTPEQIEAYLKLV